MPFERQRPAPGAFNSALAMPFELRLEDFSLAMQDVFDFFFDVNSFLVKKGLQRLDDMLRPAIMSGLLSDLLTASLAKHSRTLTQNQHFNGHPDLLVKGVYPNDSAKSGLDGVEIKTTRKAGGAVDTHGAREQWMTVFKLWHRRRNRTGAGSSPVALYRSLPWPCHHRGFPKKCAGRTRNPNGHIAPRRHPETAPVLGLSRIKPAKRLAAGSLRARF